MTKAAIGRRELFAIDGARGEQTEAWIRAASPALADALIEHAFGSIFALTTLSRREREMASVAILAAIGGAEPQLRLHVEAALRVGADRDEIVALVEHLSVYAGYPRAINMLRIVTEVFEEQAIPAALPSSTVTIGNMTTRMFDSGGDKPVMVLVHALGLDWRMWRDVIPALCDRYRVVAYDLRGFGGAVEAEPARGAAHYAADLAELIESLDAGPVIVAGLSLGGTIALELALARPELVDGLAIIAATAWSFPAFGERADAAREHGVAAQLRPSLTRWFNPGDLAENDWSVRYARDCVLRAQLPGWCAGWNALHGLDIADRLEEITAPTRIIAGECDASTPPGLMEKLLTIPGSRMDVIPGAPHMLALTHAAQLSALLLDLEN